MLANGRALLSIINDRTYERTISGKLWVLQDERWRQTYAILKANLLFFFENEEQLDNPILLLIVEDCVIELSDDNQIGKSFSFFIRSQTTTRSFQLAADSLEALGNWISLLTVCSMDYMKLTKLSFQTDLNRKSEST
uniref:PH domain-containing protein n=1 Tax=Acrobeloides nanus TaxID=290746 RepID=A0A914DPD7_9BILA